MHTLQPLFPEVSPAFDAKHHFLDTMVNALDFSSVASNFGVADRA